MSIGSNDDGYPLDLAALPEIQPRPSAVRPLGRFDRPAGHTARALGLGPPPPPGTGRLARRIGIGLFGSLASVLWLWSLSPPAG